MWRPEGLKAYLNLALGWDGPLIEAVWLNTQDSYFSRYVRARWLKSCVEPALRQFSPLPATLENQLGEASDPCITVLTAAGFQISYEAEMLSLHGPDICIRRYARLAWNWPRRGTGAMSRRLPLREFPVQVASDIVSLGNIAGMRDELKEADPDIVVTTRGYSTGEVAIMLKPKTTFGGRVTFNITCLPDFSWVITASGSSDFTDMAVALRIGGPSGATPRLGYVMSTWPPDYSLPVLSKNPLHAYKAILEYAECLYYKPE
jgi:hypothetical protein